MAETKMKRGVHVGRFIRRKCHGFLIDIFSAVHRMADTGRLVLVEAQADWKELRTFTKVCADV